MTSETLTCCNEPMGLVSEVYSTRNVSPLAMQLWRCRHCEGFQWQLNHRYPYGLPCVGAFFQHLDELREKTATRAYAPR